MEGVFTDESLAMDSMDGESRRNKPGRALNEEDIAVVGDHVGLVGDRARVRWRRQEEGGKSIRAEEHCLNRPNGRSGAGQLAWAVPFSH